MQKLRTGCAKVCKNIAKSEPVRPVGGQQLLPFSIYLIDYQHKSEQ
jgi:hypothetical protein